MRKARFWHGSRYLRSKSSDALWATEGEHKKLTKPCLLLVRNLKTQLKSF